MRHIESKKSTGDVQAFMFRIFPAGLCTFLTMKKKKFWGTFSGRLADTRQRYRLTMDRPAEKDTFHDASSQNYESGTRKNGGSSVKMIKNLFFLVKAKESIFS